MSEYSGSAQLMSLQRHAYPDPFLDFSSTVLPKSYSKMLELCRVVGMTHPQVAPIVRKIAQYPITFVTVTNLTQEELGPLKTWWLDAMDRVEALACAEGAGIDFITYGAAYVVCAAPFERSYTCNICKIAHPASSRKVLYKILQDRFVGKCPSCSKFTTFEPADRPLDTLDEISFVRIAPQDMFVKRNPTNGKKTYECSVPAALKRAVKTGPADRELIDGTALVYVQAAMKGVRVKFAKDAVLHIYEPAPSGSDMDLGMPRILPALKSVFLDALYRKADESAALERTLPARFVFPQPLGDNPLQTIGLAKFTRFIQASLRQWRLDKNAIMTSPFPIGVAEIGNDARQYNTTDMRQQAVKEIIGALGVPEGFLSDGMTWSGGSVQLRMLENSLQSYVRALTALFDFMVRKIASITRKPRVQARLRPFRLVDDAQQQQILLQLAQLNEVPFSVLLDRMDLNSENRLAELQKEQAARQQLQVQDRLVEARTQIKAIQIQSVAQGRADGATALVDEASSNAERVYNHLTREKMMPDALAEKEQGEQQQMQEAQQAQQAHQVVEQAQAKDQVLQLKERQARISKLESEAFKTREHGQIYDDAQQQRGETKALQIVETYIRQLAQLNAAGQMRLMDEIQGRSPELARMVADEALRRISTDGMPSPDFSKEEGVGQMVERIRNETASPEAFANKLTMLSPKDRLAAVEYLQNSDPYIAGRVLDAMSARQGQSGRGLSVSARAPQAPPSANPVMPPRNG